jgi:hypothetical protein
VKVYRCPHGREFVSHLERYAEVDRTRMQAALDRARASGQALPGADAQFPLLMEVKRPGEPNWLAGPPRPAAPTTPS